MNTDTPETQPTTTPHMRNKTILVTMPVATVQSLERERDEWKAKCIQQNKDLGCEMMDPNGTIWDHAKTLQRDLREAREQLAEIEDKMRVELGGHPNSKLWGEAGLIAATMRCVDALGEVTAQRDRLAVALCKVVDAWSHAEWLDENDFESFRETLQSLIPKEEP
jgi:hypothetical protein